VVKVMVSCIDDKEGLGDYICRLCRLLADCEHITLDLS
jgi:hypothetical protein